MIIPDGKAVDETHAADHRAGGSMTTKSLHDLLADLTVEVARLADASERQADILASRRDIAQATYNRRTKRPTTSGDCE